VYSSTVTDATPSRDAQTEWRRRATWALFVTSLFVVPAPYYLLFIVGWVPLACTVALWGPGVLLAGWDIRAHLFAALVLSVHVAFDGTILILAAVLITTLLFHILPPRVATSMVALLIASGLVASSFPIYSVSGEHNTDVMNLAATWKQFVIGEPPPPRPHPARHYP
jgi:hypothetical protein